MDYKQSRDQYIKNALFFENKNFIISKGLSDILDDMFKEIESVIDFLLKSKVKYSKVDINNRISNIIDKYFKIMDDYLLAEMLTVYKVEGEAAKKILNEQLKDKILGSRGERIKQQVVNTEQVISNNRFFTVEYENYKSFVKDDVLKKVNYGILKGLAYYETAEIIIKEVVKSPMKDSQIISLSRTMMKSVQNDSVINTFKESNIEYVKAIGIMDSRQTDSCKSLSNKTFPINDAPPFPIHYNCRSTYIPVAPWDLKQAEKDSISFKEWYLKNKDDPDLKRLKYIY